MKQYAMYQVDAFTDQVFSGNPAAVLILDEALSEEAMLSIAAENNLAETAFARPNGRGWDLRWFTPVNEAAFCGHATLATAHVLAAEQGITGDLVFSTRVGEIRVARQDEAYVLDLPCFRPEPVDEVPPVLTEIFGDSCRMVFRNFENLFVELPDERAVRDFVPDFLKLATLHPFGVAITARGEGYDFVSRYFAPGDGIPEDPVTGSTHATLAPYWADKLGKRKLSAFQCSRRGGHLLCEPAGDRIAITGRAVTYMTAEISVPE